MFRIFSRISLHINERLIERFPFFFTSSTSEKMNNAGENKKMSTKKKREKERIANKNLRSKKKCGKGCSNGLEYIDESRFVSTHWINDIFFFFPPSPCSNDNSRFIGMHIHRSDRIPDTRQTSESRGEMAHLNDQSVVPPRKNQPLFFSSSSPPSSPRAGIMKPIFEAHRITI